ncbi:helix-turn-helix transcriptional regulator [Aggregatimonas sangjinii]|uniref:Helix-turn-helix transcriptional regulator n=1 Tax=Aggregatimonas sangjinii TaxID=2583587 RepID=A0A5B7SKQ0_9FLAO|nr:AraC family transcriptional regulator [Aggregatimonas sangjinii]QCW99056.1 helix-turn-helix transcriptional regulator [Aggregatimonas sangjinii]
MGNYNFIDVLLLLGIAQGFFLGVTLPIVHQRNVKANKVLSVQLILACLTLLTRLVVYKAEEFWLIQRFVLLEPLIFVFGPLGYIYLKRLLEKDREEFVLSWHYYVPAVLYLSYLIFINTYTSQEFARSLSSGDFRIPFFIAELAALLFNLYFWYLSAHFFSKVLKKEKEQLSFSQTALGFVKVILVCTGVILFAWSLSFCSNHFFRIAFPVVNYNLVWISIPVLIYIVGYFALRQPEIFRVSAIEEKSKTAIKPVMDEQEIQKLRRNLTELMINEKVYLHNELTLVELSQLLNTSTNKLSWFLNTVHQSNFYDFINGYRIKAFVAKLEQNEHKAKTLFSLSMEVGFNSKSTFNKAFKASLNETPSSYIKKLAG